MSDPSQPEYVQPPSNEIAIPQPAAVTPYVVPAAAAGWYPDRRSGLMRWWNGTTWTEQFGPAISPITPVVVVAQKESGVAYLLLIFLGGLGIHHFYLNRIGAGVGMLVLTLIGWATAWLLIGLPLIGAVWIWWFVDLFLIPSYVRTANARAAGYVR